MKAYKCDLCGRYCDDVLTIHGLSRPCSHSQYSKFEDNADCCELCYDIIMKAVAKLIVDGVAQEAKHED